MIVISILSEPLYSAAVGGQIDEIIDNYLKYIIVKPCKPVKLFNCVCVSQVEDIPLKEYVYVYASYCNTKMYQVCVCHQLCQAAEIVMQRGVIPLAELYQPCFSEKTYVAKTA